MLYTILNYNFRNHSIDGEEKELFFNFLTSLANASYFNFENIDVAPQIKKLADSINPQDYLTLIESLTDDISIVMDVEFEKRKIRTISNQEFILSVQILTEFGICYSTNSFIARNLTVR